MTHDSEIMSNKQISEPEPLLQLDEHVDHLGLYRHVQRGNRFVADDQTRLERQRACNANRAVAGRRKTRADSDRPYQAAGRRYASRWRLAPHRRDDCRRSVHFKRLTDDITDLHARIERPIRVLVDHLHAPPQRLHLGFAVKCNIAALRTRSGHRWECSCVSPRDRWSTFRSRSRRQVRASRRAPERTTRHQPRGPSPTFPRTVHRSLPGNGPSDRSTRSSNSDIDQLSRMQAT